jgi:crotonobetainyl-CoA:carnitine CoA-transferase CaiB-like acyl-CoA transferase
MSETPLTYQRPSPRIGEHTAEILLEIGYSTDDIQRLKADRVVGLSPS